MLSPPQPPAYAPPNLTPQLRSSIARRLVGIIATAFVGGNDEAGNALGYYDPLINPTGVVVRHVYGDSFIHYPEVAIRVRLGRIPVMPGDGFLETDDNENPYLGFVSEGCSVVLSLASTLEAQVDWMADEIVRALLFRYGVNAATGATYERANIVRLAESGIDLTAIEPMGDVRTDPGAPRPDAQVHRLDMTLTCNVTVMETITTYTVPSGGALTVTAQDALGGYDTSQTLSLTHPT